jgi:hypothetical protein
MSRYLALRDRRLQGGVPARNGLSIVNASATTSLSSVFGQIKGALPANEKFRAMFILCHGFAGRNARANMSMDAGGEGLQLGAENVTHANVGRWAALADKVENIIVYSCAAANTERGNEGTKADGRYLMGALAIHTNATVYAADRIQWYSTYNGLANGRFEFDDWEGQLWQFPPNGNPPSIVAGAPVEFADVMSGAAA